MDAEAFRAESRERWEEAAAGWQARADVFAELTLPVSRWMVDAIAPQPGQTILDLAAGTGDTGFLAADRVKPDGRLIVTDGAQAMLEVARERGAQQGVDNADYRVMELEWIDLSTASVDGALCRWGIMLLADPEAALRECRRVLRPGSRLALAAWDAAGANPWLSLAGHTLLELGHVEAPDPERPGPFSFAEPGRIEELLLDTGFDDVVVEAVDFPMTATSVDAWWEHLSEMANELRRLLPTLSPAEHYALRDAIDAAYAPYVRGDGSVEIPARTLVAAAGA